MASRRKKDDQKYRNWFRSDRMFEDGGKWFFFTREGSIEGPFPNQSAAMKGIELFLLGLGADLALTAMPVSST